MSSREEPEGPDPPSPRFPSIIVLDLDPDRWMGTQVTWNETWTGGLEVGAGGWWLELMVGSWWLELVVAPTLLGAGGLSSLVSAAIILLDDARASVHFCVQFSVYLCTKVLVAVQMLGMIIIEVKMVIVMDHHQYHQTCTCTYTSYRYIHRNKCRLQES